MRLALEVVGVPEAAAGIENGFARMYIAAAKQMGVEMNALRNYTVNTHMSGPTGATTVQQRSGNLARSTISTVKEDADSVLGEVGVAEAKTAPYAKYLHEGTRAYLIEVKEAKALAFKLNGEMIFRKRVNHPGLIPRPFLVAALQEQAAQIKENLTAAMLKAAK